MSVATGMSGREQNATHGFEFSPESQLAVELTRRRIAEQCLPELSGGDQDAEGDGQLEPAAFLRDLRRREIDHDAAGGILEAAAEQRRLYAVTTLPYHGGRQADQVESRQAARHCDFDVHQRRLQAYLRPARQGSDNWQRHFRP